MSVSEPSSRDILLGARLAAAPATVGDPLGPRVGRTAPTGPDGITADVVYVGNGPKEAFDAAEAAYESVEGKLVLMDLDFGVAFWMSLPGAEAAYRGAVGVILTYGDGAPYRYADDAVGSFDVTYEYDWVPMVSISKQDGDVMRAEVQAATMAAEPCKARMVCATGSTHLT